MRTPYEKGTQRPSKECSKDMFRIPFAGLCHPEALARALADGNPELDMEVAGSGQRGIGPLIPERNALPMKGFLAGKTQGKAYRLVLYLAAFELRRSSGHKHQRGHELVNRDEGLAFYDLQSACD